MSVRREVSNVLDHLCEKNDKKNHSPGRKGAISAAMSDAIKLLLQGYEIRLNPYHPAGCVLNWYYGPHPDAMTEKKKTYDAKTYGNLGLYIPFSTSTAMIHSELETERYGCYPA